MSFEKLLLAAGGYGIYRIDVDQTNPIVDKVLSESNLKERGLLVLAIEGRDRII